MTSTESPRLTAPVPVELVSAAEAGAIIMRTNQDLGELEARAADARATADAVAARAVREGADERASTWAIVRLQRFLDGLREEAERDAATVVDAARRGAQSQSEERRADEAFVRHAGAIVATPEPERVPELAPAPAPVAPVVAWAPVAVAPVVEAPLSPVAVVPSQPDFSWAPLTEPAPATSNGGTHTAAEPAVVAYTPVVAAASQEPVPAPAPVVASAAPKRKRHLGGFPLSAVLEVVAVLLILTFILLRLS